MKFALAAFVLFSLSCSSDKKSSSPKSTNADPKENPAAPIIGNGSCADELNRPAEAKIETSFGLDNGCATIADMTSDTMGDFFGPMFNVHQKSATFSKGIEFWFGALSEKKTFKVDTRQMFVDKGIPMDLDWEPETMADLKNSAYIDNYLLDRKSFPDVRVDVGENFDGSEDGAFKTSLNSTESQSTFVKGTITVTEVGFNEGDKISFDFDLSFEHRKSGKTYTAKGTISGKRPKTVKKVTGVGLQ